MIISFSMVQLLMTHTYMYTYIHIHNIHEYKNVDSLTYYFTLQLYVSRITSSHVTLDLVHFLGKMLPVGIIENNKINAYFRSG